MHYIKKLIPQSLKNIYHLALAIIANVVYGFPSRKLKVIGVTGTDGKTTTVQMITKIFEQAGKNVAMASTINFVLNGKEEKNLSHYTTESSFAVQKFISEAVKAGCEYLVLETSSHALDQHRVWGVNYKVALITNVTREHLDYHKTMKKYRETKKKLFEMVAENQGVIVVNLDMEKPEDFLEFENVKKIGFTIGNQDVKTKIQKDNEEIGIINAENIELGISGSSYQVHGIEYKIKLPGKFNVENALAATTVALSEEIKPETIKEALAKINGVAGRMEAVGNNKNINILVDFALTPEALEKLYSFLLSQKKKDGKIIAVFGSCGDRDKGKRPLMAEVVSRYADYIILTNDEPYYEDPVKIIEEIEAGIKNKKKNETYWKIIDRREAIRKALLLAKAGDIIAVTGMGAEESMVVKGEKVPWNDRKIIEEELKGI